MATGDAYATAAEYRQRVDMDTTTDDTLLGTQLQAVSHYIDARTGRKDGFNIPTNADARVYDIDRKPGPSHAWTDPADALRLWLPHDVASTTSLAVKVDLNGDYDVADSGETLAKDTDFWIGPSAAEVGADPQPYEYLDIHPNSTLIVAWPIQRRCIQVTAKWGFPEVPEAIKEATVLFTRQLRDMQQGGIVMTMQTIDVAVQQSPQSAALLLDIVRKYGRGHHF